MKYAHLGVTYPPEIVKAHEEKKRRAKAKKYSELPYDKRMVKLRADRKRRRLALIDKETRRELIEASPLKQRNTCLKGDASASLGGNGSTSNDGGNT